MEAPASLAGGDLVLLDQVVELFTGIDLDRTTRARRFPGKDPVDLHIHNVLLRFDRPAPGSDSVRRLPSGSALDVKTGEIEQRPLAGIALLLAYPAA